MLPPGADATPKYNICFDCSCMLPPLMQLLNIIFVLIVVVGFLQGADTTPKYNIILIVVVCFLQDLMQLLNMI